MSLLLFIEPDLLKDESLLTTGLFFSNCPQPKSKLTVCKPRVLKTFRQIYKTKVHVIHLRPCHHLFQEN